MFEVSDDGELQEITKAIGRIICAPHDMAHWKVGPVMRAMTHRLKKLWHADNHLFYASATPSIMNHWLRHVIQHLLAGTHIILTYDVKQMDRSHSDMSHDFVEKHWYKTHIDLQEEADIIWQILAAWRTPRGDLPSPWSQRKSKVCCGNVIS